MEKNNNNVLLAVATVIILAYMILAVYQHRTIQSLKQTDTTTIVITKTDTIYKKVTLRDTVPQYINQVIFKTDTIYNNNGDTLQLQLKKKTYQNTLIQNTDTIKYQCSVEGYSLNNDSMPRLTDFKATLSQRYYQTDTYTTQTIKTSQKQNKWHIQPNISVGYGLINRQPDIYLGIGIGYSF